MAITQFIGIIPARYASTRFPGKPLALIGGIPMIQRVYEQTKKELNNVVVATDDSRIYDCVRGFGGQVVITRTDHRCGTERCLEAWTKIRPTLPPTQNIDQHTVIINIQGDEPFIQPEQIQAVMSCFEDDNTEIATLVKPFTETDGWDALENPNSPKVVVSWNDANRQHGIARMFSRSVIPYLRSIDKSDWLQQGKHYKHIGLYAYRAATLAAITALPPSAAEQAESLEQLRWIENGYQIRVATCQTQSIGIDTPEDLDKANQLLITKK
ncbi:MAG: 3-deoxy-manno-octulosonate cytidylyltransferase [Paludibacteraceae bacterium]|nr:3-deoxy-manno-octulosonate cytidylyltransferase [Paludibacteraceae bacterium]